MENNRELSFKERSLIAVGASVAAGCRPCTAYHVRAARTKGACDRGIALAVETALAARESATRGMDEWAAQCQGERPQIDDAFRAGRQLLAELTSIASAVAVNSVPDLRKHLAAAERMGATAGQIRSAIEIARGIRRTAAEKVEEAAARAGAVETGCCPSAEAGTTGCGCRQEEPPAAR